MSFSSSLQLLLRLLHRLKEAKYMSNVQSAASGVKTYQCSVWGSQEKSQGMLHHCCDQKIETSEARCKE